MSNWHIDASKLEVCRLVGACQTSVVNRHRLCRKALSETSRGIFSYARGRSGMSTESKAFEVVTLPAIRPDGFLPAGIHTCTLAEFEDVFVEGAPNASERRLLLAALHLFIRQVDSILPDSTLWLDGGFTTHKPSIPFDVDVMVIAKNSHWSALNRDMAREHQAVDDWQRNGRAGDQPKCPVATTFHSLRTHHDVHSPQAGPGGIGLLPVTPRVQPFGGMIDGFFAPQQNAVTLKSFRRDWMVDRASGTSKGFLEVKPDGR